jgi:hypothetical protein
MREIKQQIKNCEIKAHRQVATCQIPKCLSCLEKKGNKRPHKQHHGSITQDDHHPGSNTSIDHVDAANVPGYTWQHKGRPALKKYQNFMLFVDHKTRLIYPSFQESKTASEACRSKCDYETFSKRYNITIDSYHAHNGAFQSETFQKSIDNNNQKSISVTLMLNGKTALLNVPMEHYVQQHAPCSIMQYLDGTKSQRPNFGHLQYNMPQPSIIQQNEGPETTNSAHGNNSRVNALSLTKPTCTPYSVQSTCLTDACKKAHHLLNGQNEKHKRFMLVTFITIQNLSPWYGIPRQN